MGDYGSCDNATQAVKDRNIPILDFKTNKIYTTGGPAGFIHWIEPIVKASRLIVPASFTSLATPFRILVCDDGINFREVFASATANENFALTARDRGDLALVGTGSSGAFTVGSVYRTQDLGETWSQIFSALDVRVYGIEFTLPTRHAIIITSAGGVPGAATGRILRSINISVGSPSFTEVQAIAGGEGCRCIRMIRDSGTLLVGTGSSTIAGIWRSTDEGATWTKVKTFSAAETTAVYWIQEFRDYSQNVGGFKRIWAFTTAPARVFESLDDGLTWTEILKIDASNGGVTRRVVNFGGQYYACDDNLGISLINPIDRSIDPVYTDAFVLVSSVPFYNIAKSRGNLSISFGDRIGFTGTIQPVSSTLWAAKSILVAGSDSSPFSIIGHQKANLFLFSDQSGTITVQVLDETPATPVFRNMGTAAVTINVLKSVDLIALAGYARVYRINFVPGINANVNAWVALN